MTTKKRPGHEAQGRPGPTLASLGLGVDSARPTHDTEACATDVEVEPLIRTSSPRLVGAGLPEAVRRLTAILLALSSCAYLVWRIGFTLNPDHPIASALLLLADLIMLVNGIGFVVSLWDLTPPPPAGEPPEDLSVAVWIPTYNEPIEILRRTILHAVAMDHPHETWVLDDGRRDEVRALAAELGASYLTREDNQHAKAGNLNNALRQTQGDLIVSFDADFVPRRDFLTRLLGHFRDPEVALVQTPQRYYNLNSIQHGVRAVRRRLWGEQDSFFELVLAGRNRWNAAYWIGTGAILRRAAIEEMGGFPTDSVVEDMLTGIGLHTRGWRSIYVDEPLALGLAPAYLGQFLVQRLRWARGAAQNLRLANPLFVKGLSLAQRVLYLSSIGHFFEGTARAIYYTMPALFLLAGIMPLIPDPTILLVVHAFLLVQVIGTVVVSRGRTSLMYDEIYSMIRFFTYLVGNLQVFSRRPIKFAVTPKGDADDFSLRLVVGPLAVAGLNGMALVVFAEGWLDAFVQGGSVEVTWAAVCAAWCAWFAYCSVRALLVCLSRPSRGGLMFHHILPVVVEARSARRVTQIFCATRAWSDEQAVFSSDVYLYPGEALTLTMHLPSGPVTLDAEVIGTAKSGRSGGRVYHEITARLDPSDDSVAQLVDASLRIAAEAQYRRYRGGQLLRWSSAKVIGQFPIAIGGEPDVKATAVAIDARHLVLQTDGDLTPGDAGSVTLPWHHPECTAAVVRRVGPADCRSWLVVLDRSLSIPAPFRARDLVEPARGPKRQLSPSSARQVLAGGAIGVLAMALLMPALPSLGPGSLHALSAMPVELGAHAAVGAMDPTHADSALARGPLEAAPLVAPAAPTAGPASGTPRATIERAGERERPKARPAQSTARTAVRRSPRTGDRSQRPTRDRLLLESHWRHVATHRLPGDVERAPGPLLADGRAWAFPDQLDVDGDGRGGLDAAGGAEFVVASESQSYRMLQAVLLGDRETFEQTWAFTRAHLQHAHIDRVVRLATPRRPAAWVAPELLGRDRDHLFAWRWVPTIPVGDGHRDGVIVADDEAPGSRDGWTHASDADALIALSLILAHDRFGDAWGRPGGQYLVEARAILGDLWDAAVFKVGRHRYLGASRWERCIAPGYLMPTAYRVFARVDPDRDWMALVDSTWRLALDTDGIARRSGVDTPAGLPPGWIELDEAGEPVTCAARPDARIFGSDAFRALFWLALDYQLYPREAHAAFFERGGPGPRDHLERLWLSASPTALPSAMGLDGRPVDTEETAVYRSTGVHRPDAGYYGVYSAYLSAAGRADIADELYATLTREEGSGAAGFLRLGASGAWWSNYSGDGGAHDAYLNTWAWLEIARREGLFAALDPTVADER